MALIAVSGCAATVSHNCGGSGCSTGRHCHHQHRCRCKRNQQLYPGDQWGQPMDAYAGDPWMTSGGCGDCNSCGAEMSAGFSGQHSAGCGCGQHADLPQMMPNMNGTVHGSAPQQFQDSVAPVPPGGVFEAPGTDPGMQNNGALPPVPMDAPMEGAPAAPAAVDPVSWETPVFFPANHMMPQSSPNSPSRRVQAVSRPNAG